MNKKNILWAILDLIFLVVFNVLFFVFGGVNHETSVWISYGFVHFAYIMLIVTPFLIRKSSSASVFGFSLYAISSTYFMITFIVGVLFILIHPDTYKWSLIVQVVITGFYGIMLISHLIANESTADSIERHEIELRYVKDCSSKLKGIMDSVSDRQLKKQIEKVYDTVHSSQIKSNNQVRDIEMVVLDLVDVLLNNVSRGDIVAARTTLEKIQINADERNRRLKYGN